MVRRWIRGFIQRGRHGYAYTDLWDLDHYLLKVIVDSIIEFKAKSAGYTEDEWDIQLDYIINGLKEWMDLMTMDYDSTIPEVREEMEKEGEAAWASLGEKLGGLWW